MEEQGMG
jgi:hypothetical protein